MKKLKVDSYRMDRLNKAIREKNTLQFNAGSIIWNTTVGVLQVYTGNKWVDIGDRTLPKGFEMTSEVGTVTIKIAGATTIEL